ncbi:MAG TPA: hypothetical protein DHW42_10540 [Candidatus Marinimicrobia bacterium]|nr:hypothetical protein [Candidatus Neomarinimicrobiota bacterium]
MRLDAKINEASYTLAVKLKGNKDFEKAIGVLANDGVYAFYVFCKCKNIWDKFSNVLLDMKDFLPEKPDILDQKYMQNLSANLSDLLFVKEILEKMLTYTRYHLKAMEG